MKEVVEILCISLLAGFIFGFLWMRFEQNRYPYMAPAKIEGGITIGFTMAIVTFIFLIT